MTTSTASRAPSVGASAKFIFPPEASILMVLVGISLFFEALGWYINGQSFIFNLERLQIILLQMSVIGIIAVGVNRVIITSGIDLSSGSVVAATAVVSASLAQVSDFPRAVFPSLTDLPVIWPIPPFIATLGTMVAARGFAKWFTGVLPVSMLTDDFAWIGSGANPVYIFLAIAAIFHIVLRYTRFGKFTYAIGANRQAARVSGINVNRHRVWI
jgi:inositol transport system permease protein